MRRFGPSLYFASDKVIFDAINQRAVKVELVRELLQARGILVSAKTPKEELAKHFSRLTADYFDHESIATKLGRTANKERFTSFEIDDVISEENVHDALAEIKKQLAEQGETLNIDASDPTKIVAEITYEHIDYTKTEFRQVQPRDAVIQFIKDGAGKYTVRNTHNSFVDTIVEKTCKQIGDFIGKPLSRTSINLQSHPDAKSRINFFDLLIKNVEHHDLVTVTEAFCYKPPKNKVNLDGEDEEADKEVEDSPHVERVGLRGRGVTKSLVMGGLYKDGYYTVKVLWQVKPKSSLDSDIFELEAQFTDLDSCTGFAYQIKRIFLFEEGKITEKTRHPKAAEDALLSQLMEKAAKKAYHSIAD